MTLDFSEIDAKNIKYFYPTVKELPPPPPRGALTFPSLSMKYRDVLARWYWNAHGIVVTEEQLDELCGPDKNTSQSLATCERLPWIYPHH